MAENDVFASMDNAQNEFMRLIQTQEQLEPELEQYLEEASFGAVLKHPLVFQLFYTPALNAVINRQYKAKVEMRDKAEERGDWSQYVYIHERPYRFQALWEIKERLTDTEYWDLFGSVWTDSENIWQNMPYIRSLIRSIRPGKEAMMDEEEREFFAKLPDEFIIYRGFQPRRNRLGFSWTLNYGRAKWFAHRFYEKNGKVASAVCRKEDVIAVFLGRGELEVVVDPAKLKKIKTVQPVKRAEFLVPFFNEAKRVFTLGRNSIHGPDHWEVVENNAVKLANLTPGADPKIVQLFAVFHDCKRADEDHDEEHGLRAAEFVQQLYDQGKFENVITPAQLEKLLEAIRGHNQSGVTDDPTIGVCWDADRLDLYRVGVKPAAKYMSTEAGKKACAGGLI